MYKILDPCRHYISGAFVTVPLKPSKGCRMQRLSVVPARPSYPAHCAGSSTASGLPALTRCLLCYPCYWAALIVSEIC